MPCFRRKGRKSSSVISPARNACEVRRKVSISSRTVRSCCCSSCARWRSSWTTVDIITCYLIEINPYLPIEITAIAIWVQEGEGQLGARLPYRPGKFRESCCLGATSEVRTYHVNSRCDKSACTAAYPASP